MSKIGTAHIEVKPIPNEAEWVAIAERLESVIAEAVRRGLVRGLSGAAIVSTISLDMAPFKESGDHPQRKET